MKITFLGTGTSQGVPVIACDCQVCRSGDSRDKRLRTSLLVETEKTTISFDAGPDFRQQMLTHNIKRLNAIVISHEHKDHIGGIDDVRAFNYKTSEAIDVYAEERVQKAIKREYAYVFAENLYPGVPRMKMLNLDDFPFSVGDINIQPVRVFHFRLPIYGFRVGDLAYITDANYIPEESKEKLIGVKYLIINALRKEKHISHFSLREAVELAREVSPKKTYITHIGHQMGLYNNVSKELPPNVMLAYDGLTFFCNE
ncbi:MAG: MBL fold metallo-hydrolase [Bacteroidales bacterium]|nr:MBL fold metallo-hydrolase [Bacteroidales bacterium]